MGEGERFWTGAASLSLDLLNYALSSWMSYLSALGLPDFGPNLLSLRSGLRLKVVD